MKPLIAMIVVVAFGVLVVLLSRSTPNPVALPTKVPVLVAKKNLPAGIVIRVPEAHFEERMIEEALVPKNSFRSTQLEYLKRRQIKRFCAEGEVITIEDFVEQAAVRPYSVVPRGHRAVGIKITSVPILPGLAALPLSHVDVVCTTPAKDNEPPHSRVIIQNVLVLGSEEFESRDENGKVNSGKELIVTLSLLPEDALKLQTVQESGRLSLMFRPYGETKNIEVLSDELPDPDNPLIGVNGLKWAKGVALDFLACIRKQDRTTLLFLMTDDLRSQAEKTPAWVDSFFLAEFASANQGKSSILWEELSPDKSEAVFRGELLGNRAEGNTTIRGEFSMRVVVKDAAPGRWRVAVFSCSVAEQGK